MMKKIIAWITYILNLLVALPVIGVLFYFFAEINSCFAVIVCFVLFGLWGYYQYFNVIQKNSRPKGVTVIKAVLYAVIIAVVVPFVILPLLFFIQNLRPVNIQAQDYQQAIANKRSLNRLEQRMISRGATDIEFFHKPGIRGAYAYLKCSCTQERSRSLNLANNMNCKEIICLRILIQTIQKMSTPSSWLFNIFMRRRRTICVN